jgi:hypothetical protein
MLTAKPSSDKSLLVGAGDVPAIDVGQVVGVQLYADAVQYFLNVVDDWHDQLLSIL